MSRLNTSVRIRPAANQAQYSVQEYLGHAQHTASDKTVQLSQSCLLHLHRVFNRQQRLGHRGQGWPEPDVR